MSVLTPRLIKQLMGEQLQLDPLESLKQLHSHIMFNMETLDALNLEFKDRTEQHFLKTFLKIMDHMSNELVGLQEKFANIDRQVERDERCLRLANELAFFRGECLNLKTELKNTERKLEFHIKENQKLEKEKEVLNETLFLKSKQAHKYKSRALSLTRHGSSSLLDDNLSKAEDNPELACANTRHKFMSCIGITEKTKLSRCKRNDSASPDNAEERRSWAKQKHFIINKKAKLSRTHLDDPTSAAKMW